jgi:heme/copper-type cytochrome/quinol oxidase subunit 2
MSELRLHLMLTFALIVAGCVLLEVATASTPPRFEESWLYLLFAAIALIGAGLGVFLGIGATAIAGLIRIRRAERAAEAAAERRLAAAAEASRVSSQPNGNHAARRTAR